MEILVTIIHVIVALFLIVSVLLQAGKGGGVGAAFGGASTEVFGGHGAGGFLAKVTSVMAVTFMVTSLLLSYMGSHTSSVVDNVPVAEQAAEAAPAAAPVAAPVKEEAAAPVVNDAKSDVSASTDVAASTDSASDVK